jgi:hypothetical protein
MGALWVFIVGPIVLALVVIAGVMFESAEKSSRGDFEEQNFGIMVSFWAWAIIVFVAYIFLVIALGVSSP